MQGRNETSPLTKFRLLMWKNFLQQWRHPIQTVVELLLPVLTMSFILILRWKMEPYEIGTVTYPMFEAHSLIYAEYGSAVLAGMNNTPMAIAFSPRSKKLEDIVRTAMAKMILRNTEYMQPFLDAIVGVPLPSDANADSSVSVDIVKKQVSVQVYDSSQDLKGIYIQEIATRKILAGIEFDDALLDTDDIPDKMSYTIRFPKRPRLFTYTGYGGRSWRTDLVFPLFEMPGGRFPYSWTVGYDPAYVSEMFVMLQQEVSIELISKKLGKDLSNFKIKMQRYPHPPCLLDYAVIALKMLVPLFLMLSFSYSVVNLVRCITLEKELQLKETMKIMGLPTWLHWTAWFCKQFLYFSVSACLIVILLKVHWFTNIQGFSDYAVFTYAPSTVLFFFLLLYLSCAICFCFMISCIFSKGSTAALFTGVIWILIHAPATLLTMDEEVSVAAQVIACFSINSAMTVGFHQLLAKESIGGMQWGEFFKMPSPESSRFTFGHVLSMLVFDSILYLLLALYLEQVVPGQFSAPKKWNFIFTKFWRSSEKRADFVKLPNSGNANIVQENDPTDHAIGVQMINVTKAYNKNVVVNRMSLNIFDDQITVLLGHNGAGKTTTISMLTGNVKATSGSLSVAGYDMTTQMRQARSQIGLCPQHNVLFNELTVKEHLEFFGRLKGFQGSELEKDIDTMIEKLELQEKRNYQSQGLSGGQKRRLCVGIAMCGAARVVLLDEPTSGMDPASRRGLWDLLQKEKKGRSMILTTHFMDEADYLGDRVAIMSHGQLQCVGSPDFLKNHYGMGYTLVVGKGENFDLDACTKLLKKHIPEITLKDNRVSEVSYSLRNDQSQLFEETLEDLEANKQQIKYESYGLVSTTMEEVFMSLGADLPVDKEPDDSTLDITNQEISSEFNILSGHSQVTGNPLLYQRVKVVWMKLKLIWQRSWQLIVLQLFVPLVLINMFLAIAQYVIEFQEAIVSRKLTITEGFSKTETLLTYNGTSDFSSGALAMAAYKDIFTKSRSESMQLTVLNSSLETYYLDRASDPVELGMMRHSVLIGATFGEDYAVAHFSNFGYHDIVISLAAVHSAILKAGAPEAQLTVYNKPLEATYADQNSLQSMVALLSMQLANAMGSSIGILSAVFIMFYIRERSIGAKLLQKAAGLPATVMWLGSALFDMAWFSILCVIILVSCWIYSIEGLSTGAELGRLYLVLIIYGAAMLPMNYFLSHFFTGPANGFVVVFFLNVVFGMMGTQLVEALLDPEVNAQNMADTIDYSLQLLPMYSFLSSVIRLNKIGMTIQSCLSSCDFLSSLIPEDEACNLKTLCKYYSSTCCISKRSPWEWKEPGILRYVICMLISCIVFWTLLMVFEYGLLKRFLTKKTIPPPVVLSSLDSDVAEEIKLVNRIEKADYAQYGLVSKGITKYYGNHLAVNQNSFTVNDMECFGLLGVNGAGKTTTFKMLMGDETISSGKAYVSGHNVETELSKVHNDIGYCPQFDALFDELTGRETLRLFCLLRGLPPTDVDQQTITLANALGFFKHLDKRVHQYSGGNKRKLSTAVAFLGKTRLVFVDEPTTGVDPAAKRHVWRAVRGVQRAGRGVVLTSHSMEECEALCTRLTIMVNGRFQCLGTPQHLKNKFSQGFTLTIKLKSDHNTTQSPDGSAIEAVKNYVSTNFKNPKLMEEYQSLLTYYLPDTTLPWSKMFGIMERAKHELPVEYYSISQTTLEQIFLQFTKYQN